MANYAFLFFKTSKEMSDAMEILEAIASKLHWFRVEESIYNGEDVVLADTEKTRLWGATCRQTPTKRSSIAVHLLSPYSHPSKQQRFSTIAGTTSKIRKPNLQQTIFTLHTPIFQLLF